MSTDAWIEEHWIGEAVLPRPRRAAKLPALPVPHPRVLGVEDPKFMYLLRNLLWSKFVKQVGFLSIEFRSRYDFGLSFAGEDRSIAEKLSSALQEAEMEV